MRHFERRHYHDIARVLGSAYRHARSPAAEQILDLITRMFCVVFTKDFPEFDRAKFRALVLLAADQERT